MKKKLVKGKHYITYIDLIYALKPNIVEFGTRLKPENAY